MMMKAAKDENEILDIDPASEYENQGEHDESNWNTLPRPWGTDTGK